MATEKLNIVPVKLESNSTPSSTNRTPLRPVCVIQAQHLKISFYPGIKNHVIQTILKELNSNDS